MTTSNKSLFQLLFFLAMSVTTAHSQLLTQTIRGTISDNVTKSTLPGATIILMGTDPIMGASTDMEGQFKITKVPIGTYNIGISFIGYKEIVLSNIVVNSGKEVVLNVNLEEDLTTMDEVVVVATIDKERPLNELAVVSARTFSVEETQKFAAAVNDPARMVSSYAGVVSTGDGNNSISIRGNSPFGLLWRMEGVDIPNPNHFANVSSSGGGISILSSQLLSNSDFMTGAFAAEYGNALSGVFDLRLRRGNNEKREYTFQAGFLGLDAAIEGPFKEGYRGSYLVNYRYSTLSLIANMGVPIGDAITNFQDLSYHVFLPAGKAGNFSLFGFGGLSSQTKDALRDSLEWKNDYDQIEDAFHSNTGAMGFKHAITINNKMFLQTTLLFSGNDNGYGEEKLDSTYQLYRTYNDKFIDKRTTISSVLNYKFNARHSLRIGSYSTWISYNLDQKYLNDSTNQIESQIGASGSTHTSQAFAQWNYRINEQLTLNSGFHYIELALNKSRLFEPRASIQYQINPIQSLSFGYGLHGQIQPMGTYFAKVQLEDGSYSSPNKDLELSKSHHFVLAYDRKLNERLRIKTETYYQHLYDLPVSPLLDNGFSIINSEWGYVSDSLVNEGVGRNYGLELTVEQFMHRNSYFLFSASLYDSKYKTLENVWRNTRYNGNYAFSFTGGKEFKWNKSGKDRVIGLNIKALYTGSLRTTPIDLEKSMEEGNTQYYQNQLFESRLPDYFRTDIRISLKRNHKRATSTFALDIQNTTNHKNLFGQFFEPATGQLESYYQTPLIPILSYRIEF